MSQAPRSARVHRLNGASLVVGLLLLIAGLVPPGATLAGAEVSPDSPQIVHAPVATAYYGRPIAIRMTATCQEGATCAAAVYFRTTSPGGSPGAALGGGWNRVDLDRVATTTVGGATTLEWAGEIPGSVITTQGIDYFLHATQDAHVARFPEGESNGGTISIGGVTISGIDTETFLHVQTLNPPLLRHVPPAFAQADRSLRLELDGTCSTSDCTATLYYRTSTEALIDEPLFETPDWPSVQMVATATSGLVGEIGEAITWAGDVPADVVTTEGVDYFFHVTDGHTNAWWPGSTYQGYYAAQDGMRTGYHHTHVVEPPRLLHQPVLTSPYRQDIGITATSNCPVTRTCTARLYYRTTTSSILDPEPVFAEAPMDVTVLVPAVVGSNVIKVTGRVPASVADTRGVDYFFVVDDGSTRAWWPGTSHVDGYQPVEGTRVGYQHTRVLEPPHITHVPPTVAKHLEPLEIEAVVDCATERCDVSLYYATGPLTQLAAYVKVPMALEGPETPSLLGRQGVWSATIPGSDVTTRDLAYFIEARDGYTEAYAPGSFYWGAYAPVDGWRGEDTHFMVLRDAGRNLGTGSLVASAGGSADITLSGVSAGTPRSDPQAGLAFAVHVLEAPHVIHKPTLRARAQDGPVPVVAYANCVTACTGKLYTRRGTTEPWIARPLYDTRPGEDNLPALPPELAPAGQLWQFHGAIPEFEITSAGLQYRIEVFDGYATGATPDYPVQTEGPPIQPRTVVVEARDGISVSIDSTRPILPEDIRVDADLYRSLIGQQSMASLAYDFTLTGREKHFTSARLKIPYDVNRLGDSDPNGLRMYYFNEEWGLWEPASDDQEVDTVAGTVSATVSHFSTFAIFRLDAGGWASYWPTVPNACAEALRPAADLFFVVDRSGSMAGSDPNDLRVDAAQKFLDSLCPTDRAGVVKFESEATVIWGLTALATSSDRAIIQRSLDLTRGAGGGTDIEKAVRTTVGAYSGNPPQRVAILFSDGQSGYSVGATDVAEEQRVVFYTIGLGANVDEDLLREIAHETGGEYYHLDTSEESLEAFFQVGDDLVDGGADDDNDGLTDFDEERGMLTSAGFYWFGQFFLPMPRYVTTDSHDPDSDDDGINDGEEMGPRRDLRLAPHAEQYQFLIDQGVTRIWNPSSDPNHDDGDYENLKDPQERAFLTRALDDDTDNDQLNDWQEIQLGTDPLTLDSSDTGLPIPARTLFVPDGTTVPDYPGHIVHYDTSSNLCILEFASPCGDIRAHASELWEQATNNSLIGSLWCASTFGECHTDDIEKTLIRQAIASQEVFEPDGSLTEKHMRDNLRSACEAQAAQPLADCDPERVEEWVNDDTTWDQLDDIILDFLSELAGGVRVPNADVTAAQRRLECLGWQALETAGARQAGETAMAYGYRVHRHFDDLVSAAGGGLVGETGYLNGDPVGRTNGFFPKGTRAPDAVLGPRSSPTAVFDLKTGVTGIQSSWITELRQNLPDGFQNIPVHEIRANQGSCP